MSKGDEIIPIVTHQDGLRIGDEVRIATGTYRGWSATIVRFSAKQVRVQFIKIKLGPPHYAWLAPNRLRKDTK